MRKPFLHDLLTRLATRFGAQVFFADEFGYAGYIEFPNGYRGFFKGTSLDINPQGASRIASDKDYSSKILRHLRYAVPIGEMVFSPRYREKFEHRNEEFYGRLSGMERVCELGDAWQYPLFVKPNEESEGRGVTRAYNRRQLVDDVQRLFSLVDHVLIQKPVIGADYRVVVLDNEVISAYRRDAFGVTGDGVSSLQSLLESKIISLNSLGRGKKIQTDDFRFSREVQREGLRLSDRVAKGRIVRLLPNANLSAGGEATDLTEALHPAYRQLCINVARDMGLRLCGVDLITEDITSLPVAATVLEINSAPGLNNFAGTGPAAEGKVEELYAKVLQRLAYASGKVAL